MIKITKVTDLGNDMLEVRGIDDINSDHEILAQGWVSAMTNHYDTDSEGNRIGSSSREMNASERKAYWLSLLAEQLPKEPIVPRVLFEEASEA